MCVTRDKYENLILLCRNCHRKVDTLKLSYPDERLLEIKASHEAWVRTALPERGFTNLRWNVLQPAGRLSIRSDDDRGGIVAGSGSKREQISVSATRDSWASIQESLQTQIHTMIENSDSIASRVAVFPLAPVSACIYSGYLLTNRLNVRGFQYHRDQATWAWPKNLAGIDDAYG